MSLSRTLLSAACIAACLSASAQDSLSVRASLQTDLGDIVVEVFAQAAPLSACDFLAYIDAGLYDGATFYRVVRRDNDRGSPTIEVIQGGLPDEAKARPPLKHESTQISGLKHVDGTLSLARGRVGTGSAAAFFIVIGNQPSLDYGGDRNKDGQGFAAFGRVTQGMEIVRRIQRSPADAPTSDPYLKGQLLTQPVTIKHAKRLDALPRACSAASPSR